MAPDNVRGDATTPKDESGWKSTAVSAAKLFLRTVERASDAFPPLKSVAGGLCAILDNCEVRSNFVRSIRDAHGFPQQTKVNKRTIESLGSRVEALVESLCAPASEDDFKEKARRKKLAR